MKKGLEQRVSNLEDRMGIHDENAIIDDLRLERFPGSGKSALSYEDIAQKWNLPKSRVQDVAKRNGLERRRNNTSA